MKKAFTKKGYVLCSMAIVFILANFVVLNSNVINDSRKIFDKPNQSLTYPWEEDPECKHFTVQLAEKDSLPNWPLTSFPGSGVTWVRQLIEGATGIYTGSVYDGDPPPVKSKRNASATDDPRCGCTIVDKDHEATLNNGLWHYFQLLHREGLDGLVHREYDKRGVLLLRNPMDVVFTFRHWVFGGKVGIAPSEAFEGPEWDETVDFVAFVWADHAIRWIEQIEYGTVLFYEKLLGHAADLELERLLKVLNFHPIDFKRLQCAIKHRNRTDYRRQKQSRMVLKPQHQIKLMKSIHRVQESLRRKGWPRLPIYLYDVHGALGSDW